MSKNKINELNPLARIIAEEASKRGIVVEVIDGESGFFRLSHKQLVMDCYESLSNLTPGITVAICDDKRITHSYAKNIGLRVPFEIEYLSEVSIGKILEKHQRVVVKPARGEQGKGVSVGLSSFSEIAAAVKLAYGYCDKVILQEYIEGDDLRLIVIGGEYIAGAVRKRPNVCGDGSSTIIELIERKNYELAIQFEGECQIPVDDETKRWILMSGYTYDSVPEKNSMIILRGTANVHTGGSIYDVTKLVNQELIAHSLRLAKELGAPVLGIDMIVNSIDDVDYVFIEANERPGLINHHPHPTAEKFIDLIFPKTIKQ